MRVKVKMVIDGSESRDDRLQAPGVLLDGGHGVHQALSCVPSLALCSPSEKGGIFFTHIMQSSEHCLGVHHYRESDRYTKTQSIKTTTFI